MLHAQLDAELREERGLPKLLTMDQMLDFLEAPMMWVV